MSSLVCFNSLLDLTVHDALSAFRKWLLSHLIEQGIIALLVIYSHVRGKLTKDGIAAAIITAYIHILYRTHAPFVLLLTFFLAGTIATRVKHEQKARLTTSLARAEGDSLRPGGEGARNAVQVVANSIFASIIIVVDRVCCSTTEVDSRVRLMGIVTVYAAAAADTLSSELGILASSRPFLITKPWIGVPRGTNGGVTWQGFGTALLGGAIIATAAHLTIPWFTTVHAVCITVLGLVGSVLDSILGALCQATVVDKRTGLVIEGENGRSIRASKYFEDHSAHGVRRARIWDNAVVALAYGLVTSRWVLDVRTPTDPWRRTVWFGAWLVGHYTATLVVRRIYDLVTGRPSTVRLHDDHDKKTAGAEEHWVRSGNDLLTNNEINASMILLTTLLAVRVLPCVISL